MGPGHDKGVTVTVVSESEAQYWTLVTRRRRDGGLEPVTVVRRRVSGRGECLDLY
jgi:hypothetical protein